MGGDGDEIEQIIKDAYESQLAIFLPLLEKFCRLVDERAEADMLAGNPLEGAHHRAMTAELRAIRVAVATATIGEIKGIGVKPEEGGGMRVVYTPQFLDQLSRLPAEQRDAIMEIASTLPEKLRSEPYEMEKVSWPGWFKQWWRFRGWLWRHGLKIRPRGPGPR